MKSCMQMLTRIPFSIETSRMRDVSRAQTRENIMQGLTEEFHVMHLEIMIYVVISLD